ncbi:class II glutamine amidotransferase [Nocardioides sp. GY 10127]|uniref:class II glutamine amidotransferase n=1 Tax=Nocardioides sp. GY 10127 TaxID=2569762 RepID=UPI0010A78ED9|nr:class II glutamine amidotransferase [Nocardioides sp. GY 10127]TIC79275.1 class II glutamine amidotransferase [Nocardioides sp. GY 10127]
MCRLLGIVSPAPSTVAGVVGETTLTELTDLARLHGDGWGMAAGGAGLEPSVQVSALPANTDAQFGAAVHTGASTASVVHLRWATSGMRVEPQNSHPFTAQGIAFAHNGSLRPVETLDTLLTDAERAALHGTTDSERYFMLVRRHRASSPDLGTAVLAAVAELRAHFPVSSLNALVLDEHQLVAVHASATAVLPADDLDEMQSACMPAEHVEDYFGLRLRHGADGSVVIGSTGFGSAESADPAQGGQWQGGWEQLEPESVTVVDLATRAVRTLQLAPA